MFLRDSGWLHVLERASPATGAQHRQESWVRRLCVVDKATKQLAVYEGPAARANGEPTFTVPLGANALVQERKSLPGTYVFQVSFDDMQKVVTFRALDRDTLGSWLLSLRVLGDAHEAHDHPGFGHEVAARLQEETSAFARTGCRVAEENAAHAPDPVRSAANVDSQPLKPQNAKTAAAAAAAAGSETREVVMAAAVDEVKRCCGYLLVLATGISNKWRETFCVASRRHLLEFAFAGDASPLFIWALDLRRPAEIRRASQSENGRLQIVLRAKLTRLEDDDNTVNFDCAESVQFCSLQLCAESDKDTFAWALSLPELMAPEPSPTAWAVAAPRKWDFSAATLARQCARYVSEPFYASNPVSTRNASAAATALLFLGQGAVLGKRCVRASASVVDFLLINALPPSAIKIDELQRSFSVQLLRLGAKASREANGQLALTGLDIATHGRVAGVVSGAAPEAAGGHDDSSVAGGDLDSASGAGAGQRRALPLRGLHAQVVCKSAGRFRLAVKLSGHHIFGSPFRLEVVPGKVSAAHCTLGNLCRAGNAPNQWTVQVTRRDAFLNKCDPGKRWKTGFEARIEGQGKVLSVTGALQQTCTIQFETAGDTSAGLLRVTLGDLDVRESPMRLERLARLPAEREGGEAAPSLVPASDGGAQLARGEDDLVRQGVERVGVARAVLEQATAAQTFRAQHAVAHFAGAPTGSAGESGTEDVAALMSGAAISSSPNRFNTSSRSAWSRDEVPSAPLSPPLSEVLGESQLRGMHDAIFRLERILGPLREVAEIEARGGRSQSSEWKRLLVRWSSWHSVNANNPSVLRARFAQLQALEAAFSRSDLPNRQVLCQDIRRVMEVIADLLRRVRAEARLAGARSAATPRQPAQLDRQ